LFPPDQEPFLEDSKGRLPYDVTTAKASVFPCLSKWKPIFCIQQAKEIIFIPSGWYHQVHNLEDTISINHNWANGCNVDIFWEFIRGDLKRVEKEIEDCRPMLSGDAWIHQCQILLLANSGINFFMFFHFLSVQVEHQTKLLDFGLANNLKGLQNFAIFNLRKIHIVLEKFLKEKQVEEFQTSHITIRKSASKNNEFSVSFSFGEAVLLRKKLEKRLEMFTS